MGTKILRKLTIRDAFGGKAECLKAAQTGLTKPEDKTGSPVPILTIIGQVSDYATGNGDNGDFIKLKGSFEATNLMTGEVTSVNGVCILPNFIAENMALAIKAGAQAVDFAVSISVEYDETAATMYKFSAESLLPPTTAQPVSALKAQMQQLGIEMPVPRLAAPAPAAAPVPAPTPAAEPAPAPAPAAEVKKGGKK